MDTDCAFPTHSVFIELLCKTTSYTTQYIKEKNKEKFIFLHISKA